MRWLIVALFLAAGVSLGGCAQAEPLKSAPHARVELAAWHTWWDAAGGESDYRLLREKLAKVVLFAVCYDEKDALYIPKEVQSLAHAYSIRKPERYLSFTNDIVGEKRVEKDRELLRRLLATDEGLEKEAQAMVALAEKFGMAGVELDYENFRKDEELTARYLAFTKRLAAVTKERGLKLRIVLEPGMAFDAGFPEDAEYVVMFYNLYGKHSGPGAKADRAFIEKTLAKMAALPGKKAAAFATGGCLWQDYGFFGLKKGKVRFLTEAEAKALAKKHGKEPERDAESAALHFTFSEAGHDSEVWYADAETLNAWITLAAEHGIEAVSLWRFGGSDDLADVRCE